MEDIAGPGLQDAGRSLVDPVVADLVVVALDEDAGLVAPGDVLVGRDRAVPTRHKIETVGFPLRAGASKKFGAVARASCAGSPVIWHFKHGAAGLVNKARAMARSESSRGFTFGGINGSGWDDMA